MNKIIPIDENYSLPQEFKDTLENIEKFLKNNFWFNSKYYLDSYTYIEKDYSKENESFFYTYLLIIFNLEKISDIDNYKEKILFYFLSDLWFLEYFWKNTDDDNFFSSYLTNINWKTNLNICLDITYSSWYTQNDWNVLTSTSSKSFTQDYSNDIKYINEVISDYEKILNWNNKEVILSKFELDDDELLEWEKNLDFLKNWWEYFFWNWDISWEKVYDFCKKLCEKYNLIVDYYDQVQITFKNKYDLSFWDLVEISLELIDLNKKDFWWFLWFLGELKKWELTIYLVD